MYFVFGHIVTRMNIPPSYKQLAPKRFDEWPKDIQEKWYAWKKADICQQRKERFEKDRAARKKHKDYQKSYREKNREKINAYQREYYAKRRAEKRAKEVAAKWKLYRDDPNQRRATFSWFRRAFDLQKSDHGGLDVFHYGPPVKWAHKSGGDTFGTVEFTRLIRNGKHSHKGWYINGRPAGSPTRQQVIDALNPEH